jgi:DNA polymerase-3 subunit beta
MQTTKPIFQDFHLKTDGNYLIVGATDLDMSAKVRLERVEVEEGGELALPASRFYSVVREIPDRSVVLETLSSLDHRADRESTADREQGPEKGTGAGEDWGKSGEGRGALGGALGGVPRGALIRGEGSESKYEFKMLGDNPAEFPELPSLPQDKAVTVAREKFAEMLRRVAIAASRDVARFQLTGVYFEIEGDKLILTATDGKRLTHDQMKAENPGGLEARAIVPNRAADVILKVLAQGEPNVTLALGDPDFQVGFGRGQLTAKVIQGAYPDYRAAIPHKANSRVTAKRSDFLAAARSAALMTDKQTATVIFRFEDGKAYLNTKASDIGESRIEVPIALEGPPLEIRFNPTYFIDALRCLNEEEVRLEFFDEDRPGTVRGGQHYRHLVMPLVTAK